MVRESQQLRYVNHTSYDHMAFEKSYVSTSAMPMTIKLCRVVS